MRLILVLLSPTWGMHQYTADLANRECRAGVDVQVVTTARAPRDRYAPGVAWHTPVDCADRGFSPQGFRFKGIGRVLKAICDGQPDVVHFTGPHFWNPILLGALRRRNVPTIHTLHDLHPHAGAGYGALLYLWNGWVRRNADHLLVHGKRFRQELLDRGGDPERVTFAPLTHLFMSHSVEQRVIQAPPPVRYEEWALFFARLERYKGLNVLGEAARRLGGKGGDVPRVIVAGTGGAADALLDGLPGNVEVRNRLIGDEEAVDLFGRCGLVVLPYIEASQSALVAAAYYFAKPVIVSQVGALPEYVEDGETGWVIPPGDERALSESLRKALGDPERLAAMGKLGRERYQELRQIDEQNVGSMYNQMPITDKRRNGTRTRNAIG